MADIVEIPDSHNGLIFRVTFMLTIKFVKNTVWARESWLKFANYIASFITVTRKKLITTAFPVVKNLNLAGSTWAFVWCILEVTSWVSFWQNFLVCVWVTYGLKFINVYHVRLINRGVLCNLCRACQHNHTLDFVERVPTVLQLIIKHGADTYGVVAFLINWRGFFAHCAARCSLDPCFVLHMDFASPVFKLNQQQAVFSKDQHVDLKSLTLPVR